MRNKTITLALQGGGSHGAFTWGVLDRLLEEPRLGIEGISGASAGAMNAVVLAHGYTRGGRDGARLALKRFWDAVATREPLTAIPDNPFAPDGGGALGSDNPLRAFLFMTRYFSPYQLNPLDVNPLRDILEDQVDFEGLRTDCPIALFIAATRVSTGTLRIFGTRQITLEALLASACLPALHHSIKIDGEAYWDGGLTANPPLYPLLAGCSADDLLMVLLHGEPLATIPATADEIARRLTEIGFTAGFFAEIQGLFLAKQEAERGWGAIGRLQRKLRRLHLHLIDAPKYMSTLGVLSKANTHASFIAALYEEGRRRTDLWLAANLQRVGVASSCEPSDVLR
ncbi:MAG: patatin-like phospholipase family protein [Betaproteobacteria bacterium]|nr:patatin-like phospholipase family protein [Betaproteobacteria bacterium]MBK8918686.1 patatin-like phospholipase family protein [Betaproteobacteria bacterium]